MKRRVVTTTGRRLAAWVLVIVALSFCFLGWRVLNRPQLYRGPIATLDEKKETVMNLVTGAAGTSFVISLIPDDAGTPIANQLAELTDYLLIVLTVIYLEKYLITLLTSLGLGVVAPLGLILIAFGLYRRRREQLSVIGCKLIIFGLAMCAIIPAGIFVCNQVDATYEESIRQTLAVASEIESTSSADEAGGKNVWDRISEAAQSIIGGVSDSLGKAKIMLYRFIEATVVMLITSCVIPILMALVFFWMVKRIFNMEAFHRMSLEAAREYAKPRAVHSKRHERLEE